MIRAAAGSHLAAHNVACQRTVDAKLLRHHLVAVLHAQALPVVRDVLQLIAKGIASGDGVLLRIKLQWLSTRYHLDGGVEEASLQAADKKVLVGGGFDSDFERLLVRRVVERQAWLAITVQVLHIKSQKVDGSKVDEVAGLQRKAKHVLGKKLERTSNAPRSPCRGSRRLLNLVRNGLRLDRLAAREACSPPQALHTTT